MILTHRRRESIESGITKQSAHALRRKARVGSSARGKARWGRCGVVTRHTRSHDEAPLP